MRIPQGLRSALASQTSAPPSTPTTDEYFGDVSLLLYGDGTNGSTAIVDSSSNNHAITVGGNAQISTAQSKFGGSSLYFDGSGDYLSAPADSSFEFGTGAYTVEFWVRFNALGGQELIMTTTTGATGCWTIYYAGGTIQVVSTGGANPLSYTWSSAQTNRWYHIAVCRDGSSVQTMYIDGIAVVSGTRTNNFGQSGLKIGDGYSADFNGYIDDLRITKGVARYTSNFTPPTASFSTVTPGEKYFYQNSLLLSADGSNGSTAIVDGSASANTITVNGDAQISTTQSKFGGASMKFDGSGDYLTLASSDFGAMGTGDFTIEWWEYIAAFSSGYFPIFSYGQLGQTGNFQADLSIRYESSGSFLRVSIAGSTYDFTTGLTSTTNTWRHCALVRNSGVLRLYQDGVALFTTHNSTNNITNSGGSSIIGGSYFGGGNGTLYSSNGYIDDLRITKGVARYTSDFTIPTSEASSSDPYFSSTKLLLNGNGTNGSTDFVDSTGNFGNNYANSDSSATNGEGPNGGTPYWVDILPTNADFEYHYSYGLDRVHDGSLSNYLYWVGSEYSVGNVIQARFDLRDFPTVTSVRIYGTQPFSGGYSPYSARLLDSSKNVISNTTLVINNSTAQWNTVPVAGSPAFLEIFCSPDPSSASRIRLYAIEVNGQHLINTPIAANGDAQISTAQSKFGGASMKFDGNDHIEVPSSTDLSFGSGDFTIECWAYFNSLPSNMTVANFDGGGSYTSIFFAHLPTLNCYISGNGTSWNVLAGNSLGTPSTGVWHHLALVREGNVYRGFLDGVQGFSVTNSSGPYGSSALARIGAANSDGTGAIDGYIDDFRVTKGVARYGNFAVPTAGYSTLTPAEPYFHNNSLLLHGDGTNGSTTIVDDSINNHTITAYGNAQISTAQSKFGGASMKFDGSGDYLAIADNDDFELGSSDFTLEAWVYLTGYSASYSGYYSAMILAKDASGARSWSFGINGTSSSWTSFGVTTFQSSSPVVLTGQSGSFNFALNTWYHVAAVKNNGTVRLYVNGTDIGGGTLGAAAATSTVLTIGAESPSYQSTGYGYFFPGYIDDLRITKGVARYTANFTPPTSAFPDL